MSSEAMGHADGVPNPTTPGHGAPSTRKAGITTVAPVYAGSTA